MPKVRRPDGTVANVAFMSHTIELSVGEITATKSVMVGTGPKAVECDEFPFNLFKLIIADKFSVSFDGKEFGMGEHKITVEVDGKKLQANVSIKSRIIP